MAVQWLTDEQTSRITVGRAKCELTNTAVIHSEKTRFEDCFKKKYRE